MHQPSRSDYSWRQSSHASHNLQSAVTIYYNLQSHLVISLLPLEVVCINTRLTSSPAHSLWSRHLSISFLSCAFKGSIQLNAFVILCRWFYSISINFSCRPSLGVVDLRYVTGPHDYWREGDIYFIYNILQLHFRNRHQLHFSINLIDSFYIKQRTLSKYINIYI